jgi:hypothetical protein
VDECFGLAETFLGDVDWLLELNFLFADAMCFVPVKFCFADRTIGEANRSKTFHFSPVAAAVLTVEPSTVTNAPARGDGLYLPKLSDDLELHDEELSAKPFGNGCDFDVPQAFSPRTDATTFLFFPDGAL